MALLPFGPLTSKNEPPTRTLEHFAHLRHGLTKRGKQDTAIPSVKEGEDTFRQNKRACANPKKKAQRDALVPVLAQCLNAFGKVHICWRICRHIHARMHTVEDNVINSTANPPKQMATFDLSTTQKQKQNKTKTKQNKTKTKNAAGCTNLHGTCRNSPPDPLHPAALFLIHTYPCHKQGILGWRVASKAS